MSDPLIEFTVWGEPKPKERPKVGRGRGYTPKKTREAEAVVRDAFRAVYPLWEPIVDDVEVDVLFFRKGHRPVDTDNLYKLVTDALNGVAYVDDKQISGGVFRRRYGAGDRARTVIRVRLAVFA